MAERQYKIVPADVDAKTTETKIRELREYLIANIEVEIADNKLAKAAMYQQYLDTVDLLYDHSRDRL